MTQAERIQTPYLTPEDELDRSLRPRALDEFIGQPTLREQLAVAIEAASARNEALDHLLLAGPPGLGKTSLAQIVAAELEVPFVQTAGPALERKGDIAAFLTALEPRSVFFVDEIHRLPRTLEETFYPAMEDRRLPITVGQGAGARVVTLQLPPFTLVGATTRTGLLTTPLRDRLGFRRGWSTTGRGPRPDREALGGAPADRRRRWGALAIAARSRGTPRVANRLLKRVRDFAEVRHVGVVGAGAAHAALDLLEVDERGLDRLDREILRAICDKFDGGPVGLSTLAVAVGEEQDTIEDVYDPTCSSRVSSSARRAGQDRHAAAFEHLGIDPPAPEAGTSALFVQDAPARRRTGGRDQAASRSRRLHAVPPAPLLCGVRWLIRSSAPTADIARARSTATSASRASRRAARSAASPSCSSCSTTTTRRRTPRSSCATARAA